MLRVRLQGSRSGPRRSSRTSDTAIHKSVIRPEPSPKTRPSRGNKLFHLVVSRVSCGTHSMLASKPSEHLQELQLSLQAEQLKRFKVRGSMIIHVSRQSGIFRASDDFSERMLFSRGVRDNVTSQSTSERAPQDHCEHLRKFVTHSAALQLCQSLAAEFELWLLNVGNTS